MATPVSVDVIVAGLGAMGSAVLDHLSARGVRVLGIDPNGIGHGFGSSGGETRLIRKAYFEHPDYVPLLERAYQQWRALEDDTGARLLHPTGTLYLGLLERDLIAGSRRAAAIHGLDLETVSDEDLARRFPQFRRPDGYQAAFEPEAGFLLSERAVRAHVGRALNRGAEVVIGERLQRWQAHAGSVDVVTERRRYRASTLVLALGSWTAALCPGLDLGLTVTRQPLFWVWPRRPREFALGRLPCWAIEHAEVPGLLYGFPALPASFGATPGVKLGHHHPGEAVTPDAPRRPAEVSELEPLLEVLRAFMPDLAGACTGATVCAYTNSPDGHFIIDRHPEHANVVLACGFSGHGFKFASVLGEALADLALAGASALPIGFLARR